MEEIKTVKLRQKTFTVKELKKILKANVLSQDETVIQIGIQAKPNTQFYFNGYEENIISIGATGIYELDLTDCDALITELAFLQVKGEDNLLILIDYISL